MNSFKKNLYKLYLKLNYFGKNDKYLNKLVPRKLTNIMMDIGSTCNAKCPYCPRQEEGFTFNGNGLMNEDVFNTIYAQLENMPKIKNISLYAFGEPLLNKNAGEYIKKLSTLNKNLILSTNTTNLDKFTDELMLINTLQFSIEGWDKESYERTRKNLKFDDTIEKLKQFNDAIWQRRNNGLQTPNRSINCLITKSTNIHKFIETWSPYVDEIRFTTMGPYISWTKNKNKPELYYTEEMKKDCFAFDIPVKSKGCGYLNNTLTINSNGKVVLCCCDFSQHLELGDYKDLNAAFNSKTIKKTVKQIYLGEDNICSQCRVFFKCDNNKVLEHFPELKNIESLSTENCKIVACI